MRDETKQPLKGERRETRDEHRTCIILRRGERMRIKGVNNHKGKESGGEGGRTNKKPGDKRRKRR